MKNWLVSLQILTLGVTVCLAQEPGPSPTPPPPVPIDPIILRPDFWTTTPQDIASELKNLRFEWTSAAQDTARSAYRGMVFGTKPVNEALLRFKDGKLAGATLLYYNRGDAGDINENQFDKLLGEITSELNTVNGRSGVDRGRDATSAVKAEGRIWDTPASQYVLEWSITRASRAKGVPFRAEFIRLNILPRGATATAIGETAVDTSARAAVKRFVGRDHVEKVAGGAKLKDVPMVDQGQKGYCVVASVERVMRYYGASVDQHELAQVANTQTEGGTSPEDMLNSMKKLTARLGVKMKGIIEWDSRNFLQFVNDYNRATKRGKLAPEITGTYRSADEYYGRMKPEIYKEVRMKETADFGKFQREIQRSVDEGIPLLWSVRLGIVTEKAIPQAFGGHMRLIIGYDNSAKEIIYSDSWGLGHEEKRMAYDDAWTITNGLFQLQPIGT